MTSVDPIATSDCEELVVVRDRRARAVAVVALHDTSLGPAHGGIRRHRYPDLEAAVRDAVALARAMTWKCALAELPAGGGKAVILDHDGLDRAAAYRLVGRTVARLGGRFFTGPDVGTTADDLREVAAATANVAIGDDGGAGDLAAATALGVFAAMAALLRRLALPLAGATVAVQGVGAVGMALCRLLAEAGADLVVGDPDAGRVAAAAARFGARAVAADALVRTPCDVFAPCALGGVLTEAVALALPARGICGAANNQLATPAAAHVLHARGIPAVPDFVASAGALIAGASWHLRGERVGEARIRRIGDVAADLLAEAAAADEPPSATALRLAEARVAAARAIRDQRGER
ncbi:MAG: Glu/Leu/Phe/Val dehydrogenase dimerization domain-containing protein [Planctomycetota bacterium]